MDPTLEAQVREAFYEALSPFAMRAVEWEFLMRDAEQRDLATVKAIWRTYFRRDLGQER